MVDLFGLFIPKLRNAIQTIYKEELVRPHEAERTIKIRHNVYLTVYSFEVVLLLSFRLNSYQARIIRKELAGRIEPNYKPFEVIVTSAK